MKILLLLTFSIILILGCSNEQTKTKTNDEEEIAPDTMGGDEITAETMEATRKMFEEEAENRIKEGTFTNEEDIEKNLSDFLTYYTPDASKNIVFKSIGTDSTGRYTKPCDYDYVGSVNLNFTGDNYYHTITINGTKYLTLSLEYDEFALYIIKELKITDKGKKLWIKANFLTHGEPDSTTEANPQVYDMEFFLTDDDQVVFTDRPNEKYSRYFMLKDEIDKLPDPKCDPDYH